nr:leucine-rich repeat-containing protein 47-like [Leptinotarsa decemlineata]
MWPETEKAQVENRHEIVLSGKDISARIAKDGIDASIFQLVGLNYLNISETNLFHVPDEIENLINLQSLVLHSNDLKTINKNITKLSKLKMLDLSRNAIQTIPEGFADLPLASLNLSFNELESFPSFMKNNKLTILDLSYNKLKEFPDICSEELINLSELKLIGNEIQEISNKIYLLSALKVFDISSNKVKIIPGELGDCRKLKELNLKSNPVSDRRLLKLIDQCKSKQILDYIRQHCSKTTSTLDQPKKNVKKKSSDESDEEDSNCNNKYTLKVTHADENFKVIIMNAVKNVREHFVACIVDVKFTEELFKKFIQLQNKLHDTVCEKRNSATIATHDFNKFPPGNLTYTTSPPDKLLIKPLNRASPMTGAQLFNKLQTEANNLRKEKKRNTYSGIHKYLYLIEGKPQYPCLLNMKKEVISFPPITNSDISKIEVTTTKIFIEVTSSVSQFICKKVLDTLLKDMVILFDDSLEVQQVKTTDVDEHLKTVYPSKVDLNFEKDISIKVIREKC